MGQGERWGYDAPGNVGNPEAARDERDTGLTDYRAEGAALRAISAIGILGDQAFYRGNSAGVPVIYDAGSGDRLTFTLRGGAYVDGTPDLDVNLALIDVTIQPLAANDNLDGLLVLEVGYWRTDTEVFVTRYYPVPDRRYRHATISNAQNAVTFTIEMNLPIGGRRVSASAPHNYTGYIRVRMHNVYGYSGTRDFLGSATADANMAPDFYDLGGTGEDPGGGEDPTGCPTPGVAVWLADAVPVQARDLLIGYKLLGGSTITALSRTRSNTLTLVLEDGSEERYAHNHLFRVGSGMWAPLNSLRPGDRIDGWEAPSVVALIKPGRAFEEVVKITTSNGTYIGGRGRTVQHNMKKV